VGLAERLALGLAALAFAATSPARADEPLPVLIVTRSPGARDCPDASALAREVERMNGRPSLDPSPQRSVRTRLHVEITQGLEGYNAIIRAQGGRTGERLLSDTGPGCENLADALALTLAMVLDNYGDRVSIEPESRSAADFRRSPRASPSARTLTVSGAEVDAATAVHIGMLARAGPLVLARGRLRLADTIALEAGALFAFEQTVEHAQSEGELDLGLWSGFVGACVGLATLEDAAALGLCAEGYLGRLRATGRNFDENRTPQNHVWGAGGLAVDVAGRIVGPVLWHARAGAFVAREQRFVVDVAGTEDSIFESSPAGVLAGAGLRLHFE
jgi:hypothetical protein